MHGYKWAKKTCWTGLRDKMLAQVIILTSNITEILKALDGDELARDTHKGSRPVALWAGFFLRTHYNGDAHKYARTNTPMNTRTHTLPL
jgi:hypothetical protein